MAAAANGKLCVVGHGFFLIVTISKMMMGNSPRKTSMKSPHGPDASFSTTAQ